MSTGRHRTIRQGYGASHSRRTGDFDRARAFEVRALLPSLFGLASKEEPMPETPRCSAKQRNGRDCEFPAVGEPQRLWTRRIGRSPQWQPDGGTRPVCKRHGNGIFRLARRLDDAETP